MRSANWQARELMSRELPWAGLAREAASFGVREKMLL